MLRAGGVIEHLVARYSWVKVVCAGANAASRPFGGPIRSGTLIRSGHLGHLSHMARVASPSGLI